MAMMMFLPHDAVSYAIRVAVTSPLLAASWILLGRPSLKFPVKSLWWGVGVGIAVFGVWILPEYIGFKTNALEGASPFSPAVCGWTLTIVRLLGSAFVIAVAEELFFRKWLMRFAGFWWMVALFAIEHDRWVVGAAAGAAYGLLALKKGLPSAIVAHIATNLILALWVIWRGAWQFW
jgi:CAAX prenyl protease-like protein